MHPFLFSRFFELETRKKKKSFCSSTTKKGLEPRAVLSVKVDLSTHAGVPPGASLLFMTSHLDFTNETNRIESARLINVLAELNMKGALLCVVGVGTGLWCVSC